MVARQTYGRYVDDVVEGRLSAMGGASEQVAESVSTSVTADKDPPDEVRKTLDFDEEN